MNALYLFSPVIFVVILKVYISQTFRGKRGTSSEKVPISCALLFVGILQSNRLIQCSHGERTTHDIRQLERADILQHQVIKVITLNVSTLQCNIVIRGDVN